MYEQSMDWYQEDGDWRNDYYDATIESDENGFHWALWYQCSWSRDEPPEWETYAEGTEKSLGEAQQAAVHAFQLAEQDDIEAEREIERMVNEGG